MPADPKAPDAASRKRALKLALAVSSSFSCLVLIVIVLLVERVITFQMALLMLVALLGLYVGLGVLYAVHKFVEKLD